MSALIAVLPMLAAGADKVPDPEDVTAGWIAFVVFVALIAAVVLLGVSLSRHLRRAHDNAEAGAFATDDEARPGRTGRNGR